MDDKPEWKWSYDWKVGIKYGPVPVGLIVVVAVALAVMLWVPSRFD